MEREGETRSDDSASLEHDAMQPALSGAQGAHASYALRASPPLRSHVTPRLLDGYYVLDSHVIGIDSPESLHIVWVALAHGAIADMPNWRTYTGQSRERVCGDGWLDAVHPDDRKRVGRMWTRAVRERTPFQTMYRVRRRDATYIAYDARCVPVFRADGSLQEWVWSYTRCLPDQESLASGDADSSYVERLTVTQDLTAMPPSTLAPFMALFEAMADAVVVYDTAGRVHFLNAAARSLLDVAPSDDPARAAARFTIGDASGQAFGANRSPVERILRGAALATADAEQVVAVLPNGRNVRVSLTGALLRDTAGTPAGAAIVLRELRDEAQDTGGAHDALGALLALAEAVIFVSDEATDSQPARAVIEVPRATGKRLAALACDVIGCAHAGILAVASIHETVHPIAVAGLDKAAERVWWQEFGRAPRLDAVFEPAVIERLRTDQVVPIDLREPPYNQRPNPYGAVTLLAVPMLVGEQLIGILTLDHDGATHGYALEEIALAGAVAKLVGLAIERERLLHDRAEAQASVLALREAKRRMDEFLNVASHELRTPLTVIKANVQLLTRRIRHTTETAPNTASLTAKMRITPDFLDRTLRQVDRLDRLVSDLLDISRIEAGRLTLRTERFDLRAVVRETVEEQRSTWSDRAITLDLPDALLLVDADVDRIGQVVTNYLVNALKYSRADQHVAVSVAAEGGVARVAVRDHGPGLTAEQREHLWERFSRVSGIEVQSGSLVGMGLGLHISRTIIERHGGATDVESAPGQGSTFWFTLPLAERTTVAE
ncbi:MAG TPA: ATP-binding protein [Ktedonobacterales bacterium]